MGKHYQKPIKSSKKSELRFASSPPAHALSAFKEKTWNASGCFFTSNLKANHFRNGVSRQSLMAASPMSTPPVAVDECQTTSFQQPR